MNFLRKAVAGSDRRKTRLHDEKGQVIRIDRFARHVIPAIYTGVLRLTLDRRPELPWIPYSAIDAIDAIIGPASTVLEYGSGMSTIWLAKRAGTVWAVEDYQPWHSKVSQLIRRQDLKNINYVFSSAPEDYIRPNGLSEKVDLIIVDGSYRDRCIVAAAELVKPGGYIYLDNSDRYFFEDESRAAEDALRSLAGRCGGIIEEYSDFAPTQLFVTEGLLARL